MSNSWLAPLTFAGSFGFYLLLAGNATWTEGAAALLVASATAGFTWIQHARHDRLLAYEMPPSRFVGQMLLGLATDTWRVGAALVEGRSGTESWQPFHPGGIGPHDHGRRALVTLFTSVAPNGYVLDMRPSALKEADRGLLLHRLAPAPPLSNPDWPA